MSWCRAGAAVAILAASSIGALGQTHEELRKELDDLKAVVRQQAARVDAQAQALSRLEAENAALRSATAVPADGALEHAINRLNERMAGGVEVRSCASRVNLGGEFRYRAAYASGETILPTEGTIGDVDVETSEHDGWWVDARNRLSFQYDFQTDVTAFAEIQSHWAFGHDLDGLPHEYDDSDSEGDVHLYQSWLEIRNVFCRPELSARIGRQEIVLGNQFQFGNADWYNGIVHDGVRVDWRSRCWTVTALALKLTTEDGDINQVASFPFTHDDDELYGVYFTLKSIRNHALDLYWIYVNGHRGESEDSGASFLFTSLFPGTAYYHTVGARMGGCWEILCGLDWNVEGAVQTGSVNGAIDTSDVSGAALEAELGVTLDRGSRFRVFARGLYSEGPGGDDTGYLASFPNRHSNDAAFRARYGLADMIPMQNVLSAQLGLHFDPACNWTIGATGLWATLDGALEFPGIESDDFGTELDVWAEYRYSRLLTFGAGLALVFPEDLGQLAVFSPDETKIIAYLQARLIF
jgi:hypothetical protein